MDNVTDFGAAKRKREQENHPTRDSDMRMDIWLDDKGAADWSCLSYRREEMEDNHIHNTLDAAFENLKIDRGSKDGYLLYLCFFTSKGHAVRIANTEICTDTRLWHALRILRVARDDFWFMLKLAWKAWRRPIKSTRASAAPRESGPPGAPD